MTVKISNLPAATSVGSGDVLPVVQSGTTKKVDLNANWSFGGDVNFDSGTLFVDASSNEVGVGTTSPDYPLDVRGSTIQLRNGGGETTLFGFPSSGSRQFRISNAWGAGGAIRFIQGGVDTVWFNGDGNVGIGTTAPTSKLEASGSFRSTDYTTLTHAVPAVSIGCQPATNSGFIQASTGTSLNVNLSLDASNVIFRTGAFAERMRIDSSGKILAATGGGWVGTVAQSGQSSIIEQGSNANGEYIRFADGTQICFLLAQTAAIAPITTPFSLGYRSSAVTNNLPISFVNTSYKIATNDISNSGVFVRAVPNTTSTLGVSKFWTTSVTDSATIRSADAIVMGRWY